VEDEPGALRLAAEVGDLFAEPLDRRERLEAERRKRGLRVGEGVEEVEAERAEPELGRPMGRAGELGEERGLDARARRAVEGEGVLRLERREDQRAHAVRVALEDARVHGLAREGLDQVLEREELAQD